MMGLVGIVRFLQVGNFAIITLSRKLTKNLGFMQSITINVEDSTRQAYDKADEQTKQEVSYLVAAFLDDKWQNLSLIEIMEKIGKNAQARGLTPDILEELLEDE
ncbi:hypothetical protein [Crocosphaera sp.]|uniref:hypothetical protein n=1 Tax=Crocosphaera sp. TaxID=2729996 RepID=UPI002602D3F4|nr:hypothetical protein [Crocosphaera sp.]MDJ0578656.1 hypothetical protein [Crocosphaera sp.]